MEAIFSSKTLVYCYQNTRRQIPDITLRNHYLFLTRIHGVTFQLALFVITLFFFCGAADLGLLILEISKSHPTHTKISRTPLDE